MSEPGLRDALLAAIAAGSSEAIADALHGKPESERRAVASEILNVRREIWDRFDLLVFSDGVVSWQPRPDHYRMRQWSLASLACLGVCVGSELGRVGSVASEHSGSLLRVLLDRDPPWLGEWCENVGSWWVVHALVDAGRVTRPVSDAYIEAFIRAPRAADADPHRSPQAAAALRRHGISAAQLVDEHPSVLEHEVWRLFEVEGGETTIVGTGWAAAIIECCADGRLPRARVLDATLSALGQGWKRNVVAYMTRLWRALTPTIEERAARQDVLIDLLTSPVDPVVSFAIDEVHALAKARLLPGECAPRLAPALQCPAKRTVRRAITVLDLLVAQHPELSGVAADAAATALVHEAPDIRGLVLNRLKRWGIPVGTTAHDELVRHVGLLAPTQRGEAEALLGMTGTAATPQPEIEVGEVLLRLIAIPAAIREALGLHGDPILDAGPAGLPEAPVRGEPVLDPAERLAPIESFEELLHVAVTMDPLHESLDWERVADAALRWCDQPFPAELRAARGLLDEHFTWRRSALTVLGAWRAGGEPSRRNEEEARSRYDVLVRRAAAGQTGRLLALPTHVSGWIEPSTLVERLEATPSPVAADADHDMEFAHALLRLAPDGRAEALTAAARLGGRAGELLRFALGDPSRLRGRGVAFDAAAAIRWRLSDETATPPVAVTVGEFARFLWLAEEAARIPHPTDPSRGAKAFGRLERMRADPPAGPVSYRLDAFSGTIREPAIDAGPVVQSITRLITASPLDGHYYDVPTVLSETWPSHRGLAHLARTIEACHELGGGTPIVEPPSSTLRLLLSASEPICAHAARHIALALASGLKERAALATDVAITAITDGRLDASLLATPLREALDVDALIPKRLASRLTDIAAVSDLHQLVVHETLEHALALTSTPRNIAPLLVLYEELSQALGTRAGHEPTRAFLATLTGSSNAAKTARRLLARTGASPSRAAMWEPRLQRAERWTHLAASA